MAGREKGNTVGNGCGGVGVWRRTTAAAVVETGARGGQTHTSVSFIFGPSDSKLLLILPVRSNMLPRPAAAEPTHTLRSAREASHVSCARTFHGHQRYLKVT